VNLDEKIVSKRDKFELELRMSRHMDVLSTGDGGSEFDDQGRFKSRPFRAGNRGEKSVGQDRQMTFGELARTRRSPKRHRMCREIWLTSLFYISKSGRPWM
jgi:hypothetical protein